MTIVGTGAISMGGSATVSGANVSIAEEYYGGLGTNQIDLYSEAQKAGLPLTSISMSEFYGKSNVSYKIYWSSSLQGGSSNNVVSVGNWPSTATSVANGSSAYVKLATTPVGAPNSYYYYSVAYSAINSNYSIEISTTYVVDDGTTVECHFYTPYFDRTLWQNYGFGDVGVNSYGSNVGAGGLAYLIAAFQYAKVTAVNELIPYGFSTGLPWTQPYYYTKPYNGNWSSYTYTRPYNVNFITYDYEITANGTVGTDASIGITIQNNSGHTISLVSQYSPNTNLYCPFWFNGIRTQYPGNVAGYSYQSFQPNNWTTDYDFSTNPYFTGYDFVKATTPNYLYGSPLSITFLINGISVPYTAVNSCNSAQFGAGLASTINSYSAQTGVTAVAVTDGVNLTGTVSSFTYSFFSNSGSTNANISWGPP